MSEKILKVKCNWCNKEIECPENMFDAEKHICFECFQKHEADLQNEKPGKIHIDFPREEFEERLPEIMVNRLVEEFFPNFWNENKKTFKQMKKKELAEQMFAAGASAMIESMQEMGNEEDEEEAG